MAGVLLAEVVAIIEGLYPAALAEDWDAVGLVCGDPAADVTSVLFAVDPVEAVVREALDGGYDLLVTHHPLYLRGTSSVAATDPKGRVVHELIRGGCALLTAHTNADSASPGVSDALAELFGLRDTVPLAPQQAQKGPTRPTSGPPTSAVGLGRVGDLPAALMLPALTELAARVLPATASGVRVAGDPGVPVTRLAVCGGAGDSLLEAAAASGAQAFLTGDLRHHAASEAPEGLALLDASHWATEWPWLPHAAARLAAATSVHTAVSTLVTDPFRMQQRSTPA